MIGDEKNNHLSSSKKEKGNLNIFKSMGGPPQQLKPQELHMGVSDSRSMNSHLLASYSKTEGGAITDDVSGKSVKPKGTKKKRRRRSRKKRELRSESPILKSDKARASKWGRDKSSKRSKSRSRSKSDSRSKTRSKSKSKSSNSEISARRSQNQQLMRKTSDFRQESAKKRSQSNEGIKYSKKSQSKLKGKAP